MTAFYNDNDKGSIAWLQRLMEVGLIPEGRIDNRSIANVAANDLQGMHRAHFFAGIAGWELALQLAGWPDDVEVWTGSCPCQPFSCAGKRLGDKDERHLWPEFRRLIDECRPTVVFGEQVSGKDGRIWLDGISSDLETLGFGIWSVDTCSAGTGAPNIRQRLYWVAWSESCRWRKRDENRGGGTEQAGAIHRSANSGDVERVGHSNEDECPGQRISKGLQRQQVPGPYRTGATFGLGDLIKQRLERYSGNGHEWNQSGRFGTQTPGSASKTGILGFWSEYRIIECRDGKCRRIPIEPAFSPLAPRLPGHVAALRGIGNAINVRVAAEFIQTFMDVVL